MRNINLILILIILLPISILSQEERKLNKKEANVEVKRLIILTEKLQSEKEELNNKLMIEYEKLLSEMDENSNLRIQNGEFRSEIRIMQQNLIELQKSYSDKENNVLNLNTYIEKLKSNIKSDSILTNNLKNNVINLNDSIINLNNSIINLNDSIIKLNEISYLKVKEINSYLSLLLFLEEASIGNGGEEGVFNFYYLDEETNNKKDFIMEALANEVKLKGSLIESGFYGWEFDENGVPEKEWVKKDLYKVTFKLDVCGYENYEICYKLIELELAKELSEKDLRQIPNLNFKKF